MNKEETLELYDELYLEQPKEARKLLMKLNYKCDHLLLQKIAHTYLLESIDLEENNEQLARKKLRMANDYIVRAANITWLCSNVLWTFGQIKLSYGQNDSAIFCFHEIIRIGMRGIGRDSCNNDRDDILAQINDSKFEMYRCYYDINPGLSKRYLAMYLKGLQKGIYTIFEPYEEYLVKH